ncbi:MAG: ABC-2 family transporter protein [Pseudomonadales bacterium]|nr:ABC-2 family transporter protein [Pseudomonadales bacterium]
MNDALGPLWAVLSARYRTLLQYRAAAFAGFATQLFWGAVKLMILAAFFAATTEPQPMNLTEVVAYVWLGQALLGMLPWNVDADFREQVRDGAVAYDLLRPLDLYAYWFGRTLAFRVAAPTLRGVPMVVFAMVLLPLAGLDDWALGPPASGAAFAGFVVSVVLAALLATAVTLLAHISLLWTISGVGMDRILAVLVSIFSGLIVPLPLFPDWLRPMLEWQPFRGLADVPYRIYSGNIPAAEIAPELVFTLGWTVVLVLLGRLILRRGVRRMVVQGG